jgi:Tfp pilus assembly protein PilF
MAVAAGDPVATAMRQISARDYQAACETLRPIARPSQRDSAVWNLLGICESELGRSNAAREAFLGGLKIDAGSVPLNENLGLLFFNGGDYAEAKRYLSRAMTLGSDQPGIAFSLAASEIRTGEQQRGLAALAGLEPKLAGRSEYWTERGWVELRDDAAAAATSFDRALALSPEDVRALNGAASAAEAQHDNERALSFLVRARKAQPADLRTLMHFGTVCLRKDLTVDALDALERAHQLSPGNNLALFLYARAQIGVQQWQRAHDLFEEFDHRVPNYPDALYALGWVDLKLNRRAEARRYLEKSIAVDENQVDARCELAQLDLDEGLFEAAETQLNAVLARDPLHVRANIAIGDLLLKRGDLAAAQTRYEKAIAADPRSGPAHYKLSTVLTRLREPDRAAKERALGAELNAEAEKAARTVLVLAEPDGRPSWH